MCFISTYSVLNTLSEYTFNKIFTSYTFSLVFVNVESLNQNLYSEKHFYFLLQMRRNFSLLARYWLKVTCCSLLVTCCKITRYLLQNLLVTRYRSYSLLNSLVTRCRSCSLQKIACYSLQKMIHYCLKQSQVHKVLVYLI